MARRTIKQRITLDGGKEVESQLRQLGEAGEKAFDKIRGAAARADLVRFSRSVDKFNRSLQTVAKRLTLAFVGLSTVAVGATAAVTSMAKSGADAADAAGKAAQAAGLQIEAYGRLSFAADQAGISGEQFGAAMSRLNKEIAEAAAGGKTAQAKFAALGVSVRDVHGRLKPTEQIVHELAEAFSRLPEGAQKSALAIALLGRSGAQLLPFLNQGKKGIIDLGKLAEELGIVFTDEQARIAEAMNDTLDQVSFAVKGITYQIGLLFAPAITKAAERLRNLLIANREAITNFARVLIDTALPLILDFMAALAGDDAAVKNIWVIEWRDAVIDFGRAMEAVFTKIIVPAVKAFVEVMDLAAEALNLFTGIDISGAGLAMAVAVGYLTGALRLLLSAIGAVINGLRVLGVTINPYVAIFTAIAGAVVWFNKTQNNAAIATRQHKEGMDALREAIARVKAGVPGATEEFRKLAQEQLTAAKAAIENAKAQVAVQKQALEAARQSAEMSAVGEAEKRIAGDIEKSQRRLAEFEQELIDAQNRMAAVQKEIAAGAAAAAAGPAEQAKATGAAIDETKQKVEELGKTITVHSSEGGKPIKQVFDLVDGVARAAGQASTELDGVTEKAKETSGAVNEISKGIISVPEELKRAGRPADVLTEGMEEAGATISSTLDKTKTAAEEAGTSVTAVGEKWKETGTAAATAFDGVAEKSRAATDAVVADVARVPTAVQTALTGGGGQPGEEGKAAGGIAEALAQPFEQARDRINAALTVIPATVGGMLTGIQATASELGAGLADLLAQPFETAARRVIQILERLSAAIKAQIDAMLASIRSLTAQLTSSVAQLERLAARAEAAAARARAAQASAAGQAMGGLVGRYAGGGRVSGPGTGTSDSIAAWLSAGEFVLRARAVQKYGTDLLYALNSLQLPRDFFKRLSFAGGGLVAALPHALSRLTDGIIQPIAVPAFADGGAVVSGRPVNLTIDGQTYQMIAPDDVADRLAKHQGRQGLRRAGKRPSWK